MPLLRVLLAPMKWLLLGQALNPHPDPRVEGRAPEAAITFYTTDHNQ